jgi:hypothetical protein
VRRGCERFIKVSFADAIPKMLLTGMHRNFHDYMQVIKAGSE